MEAVALRPIEPQAAAARLIAARRGRQLDPRGMWTPGDLPGVCERSLCVEVESGDAARGVFLLQLQNGVAWVASAAGAGPVDWTRLGLAAVEAQALECGADAVAFQTARRGLVMKAARHGYEVTGYVMRKRLKK